MEALKLSWIGPKCVEETFLGGRYPSLLLSNEDISGKFLAVTGASLSRSKEEAVVEAWLCSMVDTGVLCTGRLECW